MTEPDESSEVVSLADLLLENNVLSLSQIELAIADTEINNIPLEEVLLVRGWITEDRLYSLAPWLKPGAKPAEKPVAKAGKSGPRGKAADKQEPVVIALGPPGPSKSGDAPKESSTTKAQSGENKGGTAPGAKPAAKPVDLPKEPPLRPSDSPAVIESRVNSDSGKNLKAYKELIRKILTVD